MPLQPSGSGETIMKRYEKAGSTRRKAGKDDPMDVDAVYDEEGDEEYNL